MKIRSKHKDYYDFVAGNDSDSLIIYPRFFQHIVEEKEYNKIEKEQPHEITKFFKCEDKIKEKLNFNPQRLNRWFEYETGNISRELGEFVFLSFCGKNYNIFRNNQGEYIYTLEEFIEKIDPREESKFVKEYGKIVNYWRTNQNTKFFDPIDTKNNDLLNCPVIIFHDVITTHSPNGKYVNPRLIDIQFNKVLTPTQCYQEIYNWLSEHKPEPSIPNSPDDRYGKI